MGLRNESARCYILQKENAIEKLEQQHFDSNFWRDQPGYSVVDGGRGGSIKIDLNGQTVVLRQYRRGGFIQKISSERYIWLGKGRTRPWREWNLLRDARDAGLPVPEPLAAIACKTGLTYRAAIMTTYLEGTQTLADFLVHSQLEQKLWYKLGLTIKKMQALGFRHTDLNANNLLIDQSCGIYIIDFDKGRRMKRLDNWQWSALYRLQRSLVKIDKQNTLHYREDDWQAFMDGYQAS
ncbi:MAG: 3-deoxy-D-manno-octulosonic acid kinase [Gammaproteobacteria bacterium]|nr:3-deoxy-D-manno-octulosonic acid kinase [Gammaproteobacteria bacterium]